MTATVQNLLAASISLDADSRRDLAERIWDTVQPQEESVFSEATWQEMDAASPPAMRGRSIMWLDRSPLPRSVLSMILYLHDEDHFPVNGLTTRTPS
jgi:hypothetical protein